jgi:hypothetical protein
MTEEIHDHTRVDAFMAARRRAMVLHSLWRPMLAGAVGAGLIIAAVAIAQPRFTTREVIVDHVVQKDVSVDHVVPRDVTINNLIPKDIEITIPRIATPAPTTPEERTFVATPGWKGAVVRGRIERAEGNGFVMMLADGSETSFSPVRIAPGGKIEPDPSLKDDVSAVLGALAFCRQTPIGVFRCTALGHDGREAEIPEISIGRPL